MDNMMKVFNNSEFGDVRVLNEGDKVLFAASDVAKALGYAVPQKAIRDHCKGVLKRNTLTSGGTQDILYIPEGDVYRLIVKSKLPSAEKFERWVFDEVLPSIRATGAYMTDDAIAKFLADPDATIKLMVAYRDERNARIAAETTLEANKPKMLLANAIVDGDGCISVGELAKILKQNGVNTGQNRLFAQLRADGYLMSERRNDCNLPTQYSMDNGWMRIKKSVYYQNGQEYVAPVIRITGKGQLYFVNKYAKKVG